MRRLLLKYSIVLLALSIIVVGGFLVSKTTSQEKRIILIVTKDQSDTASLNPTRLQVAAQLALDDFYAQNPSVNIRHHTITYTGPEQVGYDKAKEYLESTPAVVALVGDINSGGTALLAQLASQHQLPHISFFATDESIFQQHQWSFSYRNLLQHEVDSMVNLLTNIAPVQRVAVMYSTLSNLAQRWSDLRRELENHSIGICCEVQFPATERDFRSYLAGLKEREDQFDAVLLFLGANQIEHALQQIQIAGLDKVVFVSGVVIHPDSLEEFATIDLPVYSFLPSIYRGSTGQGEPGQFAYFAARYRLATGVHRLDTGGPWAYDGLTLLHEIVHDTGDPHRIRELLLAYRGQRMVGDIVFSPDGLVLTSTFMPVSISGGRFSEVSGP